MHAPRGFIGGIARALFGLWLSLLVAGTAWAATYIVLLDTDNDPATGCAVQTVNNPFAGVEQQSPPSSV